MLKYYRDENARHPALHEASCPPAIAQLAVERLWAELVRPSFDRDPPACPPVRMTSGNRYSRASARRITLNGDRLKWLTVIHETAHAWDHFRFLRERPQGPLRTGARKDWGHDRWHERLVDKLAAHLVASEWFATGELATQIAEREQRATLRTAARKVRETEAEARRKSPEVKIARRREQVARLERKIKALTTRLKTAMRSLRALERAAARRAAKPDEPRIAPHPTR